MSLTRAQAMYDMQDDPAYSAENQRKADAWQRVVDCVRLANEALSDYDRLTGTFSDSVAPIEFVELARGVK